MRCSSPSSVKYLAVAVTDTAMSSGSPYRPRGSRNQARGNFDHCTYDVIGESLTGDSYQSFTNLNQNNFFNHRPHHFNQNNQIIPRPLPYHNQPVYQSYSHRAPSLHFGSVTGNSHERPVRGMSQEFRHSGNGYFGTPSVNPTTHFNLNQSFDTRQYFNPNGPVNPTPYINQNQRIRPRPQFQSHQLVPQRLSESILREWEHAKQRPPPHCERFIVLSYNLLADYLAVNHLDQLYKHIPRHMLDWQWRKRNIIYELRRWSADVMCFQEVDRFSELEDELKLSGYSGIWKMRSGDAVDGCSIFWRTSRFKLVHEECIEYNKLGLRNNVAQVCVLESLMQTNIGNQPTSSAASNKVVVCNIHILFNPKRGEIKLGQVRILLDKAQSISKIWNNAPIVFCGDFNCTPKSPLYNFLLDQKLDLTDLARDKISGQASCVIRPWRFNTNEGVPNSNISGSHQTAIDGHEARAKQSDSLTDLQKPNVSGSDAIDTEHKEKVNTIIDPVQVHLFGSSENQSSQLIANNEINPLPHDQVNDSNACTSTDIVLDEEMEKLSFHEQNGDEKEETSVAEDSNTFLSELHDNGNSFSSFSGQLPNESSSEKDFEPVWVARTSYDRSWWTPMEIEVATGNADCALLEHSLNLRSTYTEVEALPQTRDVNGEPEVTSYNRCFLGTVDYIWRSEGLHTVRALAPIPKHAMQWTLGFPTKKWGSDHIALASELAFVQDPTDHENMHTQ